MIFVLLSILVGCIYSVAACRHSSDSLFVENNDFAIRYRLLDDKNGSINNLIVSESEDEIGER